MASDAATLAEKVRTALETRGPDGEFFAAFDALAELVRLAESAAEHADPCPGCEVCELATELIEARESAAGWEATAQQLAETLYDQCEMTDQAIGEIRDVSSNWERGADEFCDDGLIPWIPWVLDSAIEDLDTAEARAALVVFDQAAEK